MCRHSGCVWQIHQYFMAMGEQIFVMQGGVNRKWLCGEKNERKVSGSGCSSAERKQKWLRKKERENVTENNAFTISKACKLKWEYSTEILIFFTTSLAI